MVMLLTGCSGGSEPSTESEPTLAFPQPTAAELAKVRKEWDERDLSAREVSLVEEDDTPEYTIRIYRHAVGANTHYGAVTIPKNAAAGSTPVLINADGLDQSNPNISVEDQLRGAGPILRDVVFLLPTFRGRNMLYRGASLQASGDFCDAYDGAADDAIAFLNVVADQVEEADMSRVMIRGGSRGGNTTLLVAARDPRIKIALAIAAPTDFNRLEVRARYGSQFECQFLTDKSAQQSRLRILASSPLYFPALANVAKVFIFHGESDSIVPVWNATEMAQRSEAAGVSVELYVYPGYGHTDLGSSEQFRVDSRGAFGRFLTGDY
jgi:dienelactone hydrolase